MIRRATQDRGPRVWPKLTVIFLIALGIRLAVSPFLDDNLSPAHIGCWEQGNVAAWLLAGRGFATPFSTVYQPSAIMPPVFPLIVAAFFRIFGVRTVASILAIHAFDCIVSAMACIPVFTMTRRSFGERSAWWAAWGWAFSPYGIYFSATWLWSTYLLLLCLCWLLVLGQHMEDSSRLGLWAGFGLLAGFAALTEPSALAVIPFLLALAGWRRARRGQRWLLPAFVACVVMLAMLAPWTIRNTLVFHRFIPMRDSMGLELWLGNNGRSLHWTNTDLHPLINAREQSDYNSMGELAYMNWKKQLAEAYIGAHPAWFAWMCMRRAVYLWTGYWSFQHAYLLMEPMDPANIPLATSLTLLALAGFCVAWRQKRLEAIRYGGILFLYPLMFYFVHPEVYRMRPLDPFIIILGCQAILALREKMRAARRFAVPEAAAID